MNRREDKNQQVPLSKVEEGFLVLHILWCFLLENRQHYLTWEYLHLKQEGQHCSKLADYIHAVYYQSQAECILTCFES